jgi:hypothetical protein
MGLRNFRRPGPPRLARSMRLAAARRKHPARGATSENMPLIPLWHEGEGESLPWRFLTLRGGFEGIWRENRGSSVLSGVFTNNRFAHPAGASHPHPDLTNRRLIPIHELAQGHRRHSNVAGEAGTVTVLGCHDEGERVGVRFWYVER